MGNSFCGLLFARVLDPSLLSPVPAAFAAELMLFFIPSSAGECVCVLYVKVAYLMFLAVVCWNMDDWILSVRFIAKP